MIDNKKTIRNSKLILKNLRDEVLLYDPDKKAVHILNSTAQIVWELWDGEHNIEDIEKAIRSRFSIPVDRNVKEDILQTLKTFLSKQIIIPV